MLTDILRKYQGSMSQGEFARLLGLSPAAISLIYSGQRKPGIEVVTALAQKFPDAADEIAAAWKRPTAEREAVPA